MKNIANLLILGASYGSLLATKLLLGGHRATLVCTRSTADLIKAEGTLVRLPVRGLDTPVEVHSKEAPGLLTAATPEEVDPRDFELAVLAMQEPQYGAPGVRELMDRIAAARVPTMAIMNMPPLPYLARVPGIDTAGLLSCYTDPTVWDGFEPGSVTVASPDPQAFRPPDEGKNVLQVSLPTNFKVSRFDAEESTALLRRLESDVDAVRFPADGGAVELPVKLRVHESLFVPMAKWSMLLTGNYRCIRRDDAIPIRDAVHSDIEASKAIYDWVGNICIGLGAAPADLVPFEKYANAAKGLSKPSSAARALFGGARHIERVDCLVRSLAAQQGQSLDAVDEIVALVDARLERNRAAEPQV
jgi:hypothetical protein